MRSESTSEDVPFDRDVAERGGYVYTTVERLSTAFAMERQTRAMVSAVDFRGRRVVDIGCGDGAATVTLHDSAGPAEILGFDPATLAMPVARRRAGNARCGLRRQARMRFRCRTMPSISRICAVCFITWTNRTARSRRRRGWRGRWRCWSRTAGIRR